MREYSIYPIKEGGESLWVVEETATDQVIEKFAFKDDAVAKMKFLNRGGAFAGLLAKASNTLNKLTFVLLYATDFADRLEKEIVPSLKAGFIVLTDRYFYTALARAGVRGVDRAWLRSLYGCALAPHLIFYLRVDVDTLIRRVLQSARGMDFWESGMDMKSGDDIYDSFRTYQGRLMREYSQLAEEFGFRVLDGRQPVDRIQQELRRQIGAFLAETGPAPDRVAAGV